MMMVNLYQINVLFFFSLNYKNLIHYYYHHHRFQIQCNLFQEQTNKQIDAFVDDDDDDPESFVPFCPS